MNSQIQESSEESRRKTVAVIGANHMRHKYGNKSVRAHIAAGWEVFPVHPTETTVENLKVYPTIDDVPVTKLDRITLYVPPAVGIGLLEGIARKSPGEVWLNPGTANDELLARAEALELPVIQACSIIDVGPMPTSD